MEREIERANEQELFPATSLSNMSARARDGPGLTQDQELKLVFHDNGRDPSIWAVSPAASQGVC